MTPDDPKKPKSDWDELREEAIKRLRDRRPDVSRLTAEDLEPLVHELEVRHAELEVQNEELRRAQLELSEVRDRYQELYEEAPVGYLTVDGQWKITRANLAASKICGLDRGEMIGRRIETLVMPEGRDACYKHLHNVTVTQSKQSCELQLCGPDDSLIWALMETSPVGGTHGEGGDAYRVTITDVTDRKESEEQLRLQQERLRLAVGGGEIGLWESDLRTEKTTWSDTLYELLGRDRDPPITREDFFKFIHEEDRPRLHRHATQWFSSGGDFEDEFRIVRADGQVRWLAALGKLYRDEEGKPLRVAGVNFDITYRKLAEEALRRSEQRYHQLFESMSEGLLLIEVTFDDSGEAVSFRFLDANPSLERMTTLKRKDIIGKDVREVLPEIEPYWIETFGRVAATGKQEHIEQFNKDLDSWFDVYAYRPESGKVALIYTNTTERRRADEERERLLAERTAVMEGMSDGLVLADPEGRIVFHNPASMNLHGYPNPREALVPMDEVAEQWEISDLEGRPVPVEDWPMPRALRGDTFSNYELLVRRSDKGNEFIGRYSGSLLRDGSGEPICAMLLVHDITEEQRAKQELERRLEELRKAIRSAVEARRRAEEATAALAESEARTERKNEVLSAIARIFHEALTCKKKEELARFCLKAAEEVTESEFGFIGEIDRDTKRLVDIAISDPGWDVCRMQIQSGHGTTSAGLPVQGIYGRAILDGKGFFTNDPPSHPAGIGTPEGHPALTAFLGVPLMRGHHVIGMIGLANREGGYERGQLEAIEGLAPAVVQAFLSKQSDEAFQLGKKLSDALNLINVVLHSTLDPNEILQRLVARGSEALRSDSGAISMRREKGWIVTQVHGMPADLIGRRTEDDEESHALLALQSGRPVAVEDALTDDRVNREHLRRRNVRAVLVAPIMTRAEPLGVVFFNYHSGPRPFVEQELTFATQLAAAASSALENARLFDERKKAEEALHELSESLEQRVAERTAEVRRQADRLRALAGQLSRTEQRERMRLAQVLHDNLQQILVAARMQIEWLKHAGEPDRIRTAAQAADALLREAVETSRSLATDLIPPALRQTGLIGGLNWLSSRMLERNQFAFTLRADNKAEPATEDIRFLLFECARELLHNSMKHSGVNEAELTLVRTNDNRIRLTVSDKGEGFDPESIDERASDSLSFGLFSIQQRLSHIGGEMEIETAPGKGMVVTLIVPAGGPEPTPAEISRARGDRTRDEELKVQGKRNVCKVLIVDDHKIMREGLAGLFQFESDIEVVGEGTDGPQAVELAEKLKPHVVVMDVNLGEMNGIEATRRILAKDPEIKVIGLSMHADRDVAAAMRSAGAAAYLPKSGLSEDLIATIRACHRS